ncbi:Uncharacterized protein TCM_020937 [Theobroma cacao]|uniref:Uncharacterized protein n=1 Tax=Theobroma cacao TaxID=3641 RepID=A0A061EMP5_THECC|nr:Uncharacterized protein TCM_020937 [Theobroma cacao]
MQEKEPHTSIARPSDDHTWTARASRAPYSAAIEGSTQDNSASMDLDKEARIVEDIASTSYMPKALVRERHTP